jgi:hypothetical protein
MATTDGPALHKYGCLFCRRRDGGFTGREHIFSEALGNHEHVLPAGVVCDRCNNGDLAVADEALVNFQPITLLRAERGLPSKAGKPVASRWGNATIVWERQGTMNVYGSRKAIKEPRADQPGALGNLNLTTGGPLTAKRIGLMIRSVWKSTLEFVYVDHGPEIAYDAEFDAARDAILGRGDAHGWAVLPRDCQAGPNVTLTYEPRVIGGSRAMPVCMDVFGVAFYTDLLRRDIPEAEIEPPWPANIWIF